MLVIAIFLAISGGFSNNVIASEVRNGSTSVSQETPNGQADETKRMTNFRLNKFLDFRARSDNYGSFLSYLNNDFTSYVPEGLISETPFKEPSSASTPTVLNSILKETNAIKNELMRIEEVQRNCNYDNRTNVLSRSSAGVYYDKSFDDGRRRSLNVSQVPKDCNELMKNGINKSGVYEIQPVESAQPFMVLCDFEVRGGGWTHIHKRFDGSQDFALGWREYKFGFGDLEREFWLGLKNIHLLTKFGGTELLVEIEDRDGVKAYAHYTLFEVGPEQDGFPLKSLKGFSGDAGNSLENHSGSKFTTKDLDQDAASSNCAETYHGGWWYNSCFHVNLNGKFLNMNLPKAYEYRGMHWKDFRGHSYSHAKARMLLKIK